MGCGSWGPFFLNLRTRQFKYPTIWYLGCLRYGRGCSFRIGEVHGYVMAPNENEVLVTRPTKRAPVIIIRLNWYLL